MAVGTAKLNIPAKPALPIGTSTSAQVVWFMSKDDSTIAKYNMTVLTTGQSVDLPMTIDQVVNAEIECPENWTLIDGGTESTCVRFFDKSMNFGKAESFCNSLGATLAFPTHYDWSELVPMVSGTSASAVWTGLTSNRKEWKFWQTVMNEMSLIPELYTLTGTRFDTNLCASLDLTSGKLERIKCWSVELPFICQLTKPKFRYCGDNNGNLTEWILAGQTCLKLFHDLKSPIKNAQETCRKAGGRIASITSSTRTTILANVAEQNLNFSSSSSDSFYVNAQRGSGDSLLSSDIFGNIHNVSVAASGSSDCFVIQSNDASVSSVACNSSHFVLCERLSLPESRRTSAFFSRKSSRMFLRPGQIDVDCPNGWSKFNHQCFKVFNYSKSQEEAFTECQKPEINGYLTSIESKDDLDFVKNLISSSIASDQMAWIGLATGGVDGGWLYLDGRGSPNNIDFDLSPISGVAISGVAIAFSGSLQTLDSTVAMPFVCKLDPTTNHYARRFSGRSCPLGSTLINGTCISPIESSNQTFFSSKLVCNNKFGLFPAIPWTTSMFKQQLKKMFQEIKW